MVLFLYILLVPWIRGIEPNVRCLHFWRTLKITLRLDISTSRGENLVYCQKSFRYIWKPLHLMHIYSTTYPLAPDHYNLTRLVTTLANFWSIFEFRLLGRNNRRYVPFPNLASHASHLILPFTSFRHICPLLWSHGIDSCSQGAPSVTLLYY